MTTKYAHLRTRLEEERDNLILQLKELGVDIESGSVEIPVNEGFADSAAATAEKAETLALIDRLQVTLSDVEEALARMEAGTYGKCEVCGEEIPMRRLEARPHALRCISCQR